MHVSSRGCECFALVAPVLTGVLIAEMLISGSSASAAPTVGVGSTVNCPGAYLQVGTGKVCRANPDYKNIIYLGEKSRKSCKFPYTRVNAGDSKWCVTYPDS